MIAMAEPSADSSRFDDEVRQRWGATSAYQESQERLAGYSTEDRHHAQVDQEQALQGVIEAMDHGLPPTSLEAMVAADKCRQVISRWYFECSKKCISSWHRCMSPTSGFGSFMNHAARA